MKTVKAARLHNYDGATGQPFAVAFAATRPAADYTPRLVPHSPGALVPLEAAQILWQR